MRLENGIGRPAGELPEGCFPPAIKPPRNEAAFENLMTGVSSWISAVLTFAVFALANIGIASRAIADGPPTGAPPPAPAAGATAGPGAATGSAAATGAGVTVGTGRATHFSFTDPNSWPFIPIPEIIEDPFAGTTVGLMAVFLHTDPSQQITSIIAPDINYNTILGPGANMRYLAYPSADSQWYAMGGGAENEAGSVELDYATGMERKRWWSLEGHFLFQRDPTERFFGIGNNSNYGKQTNYALQQVYGDGIFGVNLTPHLQIALRERPRFVRIFHGALTTLPFMGKLFPRVKGLNGGTEFLNEIIASYDTRDSLNIPTRGGLIALFAGAANRAFFSSSSYSEFAGDFRRYYRLNDRIILAGQAYIRYVPAGNETPFWAMSWLGGDAPGESSLLGLPVSDAQTWRGGGVGRYIDNNMFLLNFEARTRVWDVDMFNTHASAEIAPFIDLGKVFHNASGDPFWAPHPAGGLGFRAVVQPFVVAFVDIGYGSDGTAVFTGINYPF